MLEGMDYIEVMDDFISEIVGKETPVDYVHLVEYLLNELIYKGLIVGNRRNKLLIKLIIFAVKWIVTFKDE